MMNSKIWAVLDALPYDDEKLCQILYPSLKHPKRALTRLKKGLTNLTANQLLRLSGFLNIPHIEILEFKPDDIIEVQRNESFIRTFHAQSFVMRLNCRRGTTFIYDTTSEKCLNVSHGMKISLDNYVNLMNDKIISLLKN